MNFSPSMGIMIGFISCAVGWAYGNFFLVIAGSFVMINEIVIGTDVE